MKEKNILIQVLQGDDKQNLVAFNGTAVEVSVAIAEVILALLKQVEESYDKQHADGVYKSILHLLETERS